MATETNKPQLNIGVTGIRHYETTDLGTIICKVLSQKGNYTEVIREATEKYTYEENELKSTPIYGQVSYETNNRRYLHTKFPDGNSFEMTLTRNDLTELDALVVVVSAPDGPVESMKDSIKLAKEVGIDQIIVFVSKIDELDEVEDADLIEIVIEFEIPESLERAGYDGDNTPIIQGSIPKALAGESKWVEVIEELLNTMDEYFTIPS